MAKKKKAEKKVSCSVCRAQYNKFCTIKKVSVSLNKKRHCDKYVFEDSKVKEGVPIPTKRVGFKEKELMRKERKDELKRLKALLKEKKGIENGTIKESRIYKPQGDERYPLTGDLSRFTTTGSGDKEEKDRQRRKI